MPRPEKIKKETETETEEQEAKDEAPLIAPKDEMPVAFFLHSLLYVFFLTSLTFLSFLYKNNYPLILNNEILPEVLFVFGILFFFSFISLFLLSFSRFLSRLFLGFLTGGAAAYITGLLYPYNIGEFFAHFLGFLPNSVRQIIAGNGNLAVGIIVGVVFFAALKKLRGGAMAFLSLPALCALFLLLNAASKQNIPEIKEASKTVQVQSPDDKTDNIVYLVLSDHVGYSYALEKWQEKERKISSNMMQKDKIPYFINDFFQTNNFIFYPHVFTRYTDRYRSIGSALNPSMEEVQNDFFRRDNASYYVNSEDAKVFVERNDLFKNFKEKGYSLNVYQSYPFDYCEGAEENVDKCYTYPAPLGELYNSGLSISSRLMLLAGHWLNSFPLGRSAIQWVRSKMVEHKASLANVPFFGNPLSLSLPVGQANVLSRLQDDVLNAKGKNVFFAHINLPHYPYVYDRYCRLNRAPEEWRSYAAYDGVVEINGEEERWEAYNQQLACTYGQINHLFKNLETAKLLPNTKIIIHGDKGAGLQPEAKDIAVMTRGDAALDRLKRNIATVFAVYTPGSKKPEVKVTPCDVPSLVSIHALGEKVTSCQMPDLKNMKLEEKQKAELWLTSVIADADYKQKKNADIIYADWLKNGGQSFITAAEEHQKQTSFSANSNKMDYVASPAVGNKTDMLLRKEDKKTATVVSVPVEKQAEKTLGVVKTEVDVLEAVEIKPADDKKTEIIEKAVEELAPVVLPDADASFVENKWKTLSEADAVVGKGKEADKKVKGQKGNGSKEKAASKNKEKKMPQEKPVADISAVDINDIQILEQTPVVEEPGKSALQVEEQKAVPENAVADISAVDINDIQILEQTPVIEEPGKSALQVEEQKAVPENAVVDISAVDINDVQILEQIAVVEEPVAKAHKKPDAEVLTVDFTDISEQGKEVVSKTVSSEKVHKKTDEIKKEAPVIKAQIKAIGFVESPEEAAVKERSMDAEIAEFELPGALSMPSLNFGDVLSIILEKESISADKLEQKAKEALNAKPVETETNKVETKKAEPVKLEQKKQEVKKVEPVTVQPKVKPKKAENKKTENKKEKKSVPVKTEQKKTKVKKSVPAEARKKKAEVVKEEAVEIELIEVKEVIRYEDKTNAAVPSSVVNKDDLDVTTEFVTEKVSPSGEKETYIFIERKPNPKRFGKKQPIVQKELKEELIREISGERILE